MKYALDPLEEQSKLLYILQKTSQMFREVTCYFHLRMAVNPSISSGNLITSLCTIDILNMSSHLRF
jgi:hypothetical protein